jgi:hypothetical protein
MKRAVLATVATLAGVVLGATSAMAQSGAGSTERATTVKSSKSNTSDRIGGGGGGGQGSTAKTTTVKSSKSNTSDRMGGGGGSKPAKTNLNSSRSN